jgi:acyl carrier protein
MAGSDCVGVGQARPDAADIRAWLVEEIAALVRVPPNEIDVHEPFVRYGVGSAQALELAAKLEDWIGFSLSPTLIWDYPSIDHLARHLADTSACPESADGQDDE